MRSKKRPQYIEKQLKEVNDYLRNIRLKFDQKYSNDLFMFWCNYLQKNGWYQGFNMHHDKEVTYHDGTKMIIRALAGPDYEKKDYYIQIW